MTQKARLRPPRNRRFSTFHQQEELLALLSTGEMQAVAVTLLPRLLAPLHRLWLAGDGRRLASWSGR